MNSISVTQQQKLVLDKLKQQIATKYSPWQKCIQRWMEKWNFWTFYTKHTKNLQDEEKSVVKKCKRISSQFWIQWLNPPQTNETPRELIIAQACPNLCIGPILQTFVYIGIQPKFHLPAAKKNTHTQLIYITCAHARMCVFICIYVLLVW
jgi:hypothetical protein